MTSNQSCDVTAPRVTSILTQFQDVPLCDLSGRVRLNRFCNQGGFGAIYQGDIDLHGDGCLYPAAVKLPLAQGSLMDREKAIERLLREARVWNSLRHTNLVPLYGSFKDPNFFDLPCLVMPYYENGDVYQYLRDYPQADRLRLIMQTASAIQYLHRLNIVHGDIKANNILINNHGQAMLADFGLSRVMDISGFTTETLHGNTRWLAPELLAFHAWCASQDFSVTTRLPCPPKHTMASDTWAFGLTILEIFTERRPFCSVQHTGALAHQIVSHNRLPMREECPEVPDRLWNALVGLGCWTRQPERRPSIDKLLVMLKSL